MTEPFDYGKKLPDGQHERHPGKGSGRFVRPIRRGYRHDACGQATECPQHVAETMARDPKFYQRMFCVHCAGYFAVEQFLWLDDNNRKTDQRLGS